MPAPLTEEAILSRIDATGDCWEWTGYLSHGYGAVAYECKSWRAHRLIYTMLVDEIPEGLVLDHLCRNKSCVNPDHLEPVTWAENIKRGVHTNAQAKQVSCIRGHELDYTTPDGRRQCKVCQQARGRKHRASPNK